jgi:hypothetical protein
MSKKGPMLRHLPSFGKTKVVPNYAMGEGARPGSDLEAFSISPSINMTVNLIRTMSLPQHRVFGLIWDLHGVKADPG